MTVSCCSSPKKVDFAPLVIVRPIPCVHDMSNDEIDEVWYRNRDFQRHRHRDRKLVEHYSSQDCDEELLSMNGLETERQKKERRERVRRASLSVLLEQEQQWQQGETHADPELIARVYGELTKASRYDALRTGLGRQLYINGPNSCVVPKLGPTRTTCCSQSQQPQRSPVSLSMDRSQ